MNIDLLEIDIGEGQDAAEVLMLAAVHIVHAGKAKGLDVSDALASLRNLADEEEDGNEWPLD